MILPILALAAALAAPTSADMAGLLGSWGPCAGCPYDLNADGVVNSADLALLLGGQQPSQTPVQGGGVAIRYDATWVGFITTSAQPVILRVEDIRQMWPQVGDVTELVVRHSNTGGCDVSIIYVQCPLSAVLAAVKNP